MQARQVRGRVNSTSTCALSIEGFELSPGPDAYLVGYFDTISSGILLHSQGFNQSGGAGTLSLSLVNTNYNFADLTRLEVVEGNSGGTSPFTASSRVLASFEPSLQSANSTVYLDNCLQVTPNLRVRWTLLPASSEIDLGLEALLPEAGWVGFGPALPGIKKSLMPGSDVFLAGFIDQRPFLVDSHISGYEPCTYGAATEDLDGVCDDYSWAGRNASADDLHLLYAHQFEGVSFFRFRRALKTGDLKFDNDITPFEPQSFVYATGPTGPLWSGSTGRPWAGPQIQQHGLGASLYYGQIDNLVLSPPDSSFVRSCIPFENLDTKPNDGVQPVTKEAKVWPNVASLSSDGAMQFRWELQGDSLVTLSLQTSKAAKWLALGFGERMVGAHAYVGWIDASGKGQVQAYTMSSQTADGVHPANESLTNVSVVLSDGLLSMVFTRPLALTDSAAPSLDPNQEIPVLWAVGRQWSDTNKLDDIENVHFDRSGKPVLIKLSEPSGGGGVAIVASSVAGPELDKRLAQHGWLMWAAFLVLGPITMLVMRHTSTRWRALFPYSLFAALILAAVGLGLGLAATQAPSPFEPGASLHAKVGVAVLLLFLWELVLGLCYGSRSSPNGGKEWILWTLLCYLPGVALMLLAMWDVLLGLSQAHAWGLSDRAFKVLVLLAWYVWVPFLLVGLWLEWKRFGKNQHKPSWLFWSLCIVCAALIIGVSFPVHTLSTSPVSRMSYAAQNSVGALSLQKGPVNFAPQAYTTNFSYTESSPTASPVSAPTSSPSSFELAFNLNLRRQANASLFDPQLLANRIAQTLQTRSLSTPSGIRMTWPNTTQNGDKNEVLPVRVQLQGLHSTLELAVLRQLTKADLPQALVALGLPVVQTTTPMDLPTGSTLSAIFSRGALSTGSNFLVDGRSTDTTTQPTPSASANRTSPRARGQCPASVMHLVGDGWCDTQPSINSPRCRFDGGDCCNVSSPRFYCRDPASPHYLRTSPNGTYPAPLNPRYTVELPRVESSMNLVQAYNNYYEFGFSKDIYPEALKYSSYFNASEWIIEIGGLVERPMNISVSALLERFPLETRLYRHRCVEAWSIVVPWVGFPLAALLESVKPLASAKYIQFETWFDPSVSIGQKENPAGYSYPYVEGLTLEEGMNELTFLSVGQYQQSLPAQSGAPIRLTVPWKYGFKSIKALKSINLVVDRPYNFWQDASQGLEYGFWANVNPRFPHRRWSQSNERFLQNSASASSRLRTLLYNGYEAQVKHMYTKMEAEGIEDLWH